MIRKFWCRTTRGVTCPFCGRKYNFISREAASVIAAVGCGCREEQESKTVIETEEVEQWEKSSGAR